MNDILFFPCIVVASKEAGPGKLAVNVRAGGADVDSLVREGDNGIYEIVFHPTRAAPHRVHIKYNEVHIPGISNKYPLYCLNALNRQEFS